MSTVPLDVGAPKPELVAEVEALKQQLSALEVNISIFSSRGMLDTITLLVI